MEILNGYNFSVEMPKNPSKKQKLAFEVAKRISEYMGRNDPKGYVKVTIEATSESSSERTFASKDIYISEGIPGGEWWFKSNTKIIEAVYGFVSRVHKLDKLTIKLLPDVVLGTFTYDTKEATKGETR
jgi:hypothetical protein